MNKSGPRATFFVCAAIQENQLITKVIESKTCKEANQLFQQQFHLLSQETLGPFFKKRPDLIAEATHLKFTKETKKAIYHGWLVNAMMLSEPAEHACLIFIKRMDQKKMSFPSGTIIVPISELQFL